MEIFLVRNEPVTNVTVVDGYGMVGWIPKVNLRETGSLDNEDNIFLNFLQLKLDQLITPESKLLWLDWALVLREDSYDIDLQMIRVTLGGDLLPMLKDLIYYDRRELNVSVSLRYQKVSGAIGVAFAEAGLTGINEEGGTILYKSGLCPVSRGRNSEIGTRIPEAVGSAGLVANGNWRIHVNIKLNLNFNCSCNALAEKVVKSWKVRGEEFIVKGKMKKEFNLTIVSDDNRRIRCHKEVLVARSQVLAAMLEGDRFKEGARKEVEMDGSSVEIRNFLFFLYTGDWKKAAKNPGMAMKLFEMGDYYNVEGLAELMKVILLEGMISWYKANDALALYLLGKRHLNGANGEELLLRKAEDLVEMKSREEIEEAKLFAEVMKIEEFSKFLEETKKCGEK